MSIKSAQAKQQLRNSDGTFANENKNAGLPSNDMIQRAKSLLDSKSKTEENVLTSSFLPMSARVGLCERYLAGEVEDTDGTLEYLTNQAKTIEERNDGSQVLTDTWDDARDEDIEWATRQFNELHQDYPLEPEEVIKAKRAYQDGTLASLDLAHCQVMDAAVGRSIGPLLPDPTYSSIKESLSREMDKPVAMYANVADRFSYSVQNSVARPGEPCWHTPQGYVSMTSYHAILDDGGPASDRYFIYVNGTDEDRRELSQHWDDRDWLRGRADECEPEATGRATDLYVTTYPEPEYRAGRGIIEVHRGNVSSDEWG